MNNVPLQQQSAPKIEVSLQANPAAGAQFSWSPDTNYNCQLLSVYFVLATDANAADRISRLKIYDGTRDVIFFLPDDIQVASKTCAYYFSIGCCNTNIANTTLFRSGPLPSDFIMPHTFSLKSEVHDIQATDQLSNIVIAWNMYMSF